MEDILYEAAIKYKELMLSEYYIVLGRKNREYHLHLKFLEESFYHLVGLQHLTDIKFPTINKERMFREILNKRINLKTIEKSVFYQKYNIESRVRNLSSLPSMIEDSESLFKINDKMYMKYTNIKADYLCEYVNDLDSSTLLFFIKQDKHDFKYRGISFFVKGVKDYTYGKARARLLFNGKISKCEDGREIMTEIYRNPRYTKNIENEW